MSGEIAQCVKCSLHEYKTCVQFPEYLKGNVVANACNPSTGELEKDRFLGLMDQPVHPNRYTQAPGKDPVSAKVDSV